MIEEITVQTTDPLIIYTHAASCDTADEYWQYINEQRGLTNRHSGYWRRFLPATGDNNKWLCRVDISPEPLVMPIGVVGPILERIE